MMNFCYPTGWSQDTKDGQIQNIAVRCDYPNLLTIYRHA